MAARRFVASALVAGFAATLTLAAPRPAAATDDFADAAKAKVDYTKTTLTSTYSCASLLGRRLSPNATITSAAVVPATATVPAFCDVHGTIAPSNLFDVALPIKWNQRLYALGNGACGEPLAGNVAQSNVAVANGFAVASTDTGHEASPISCTWAAHRPDLVVDFAYRGIHDTAVVAKELLHIFYSRAPLFSYYNSCSDGGHDGLEEAQKYPSDYDGIVAGSPLLGAGTVISNAWTTGAFADLPAAEPFTAAKIAYVGSVVYAKCDKLDGLADGIITEPRECAKVFDPQRDLAKCGPVNGNDCLTAAQLRAYVKAMGPVISLGHPFYPGQPYGVEPALVGAQIAAPGGSPFFTLDYLLSEAYTQYLLPWPRTNPNEFSNFTFNFNEDPYRIYPFRVMFDPTNLDMSPFFKRGGKIISYHGWADPLITPYGTVAFYEDESRIFGRALASSYRLFMVPGMGHCSGGVGADQFDPATKIIDWVEAASEPQRIFSRHIDATTGKIAFTRPLCMYPLISRYVRGNPLDSTSFACVSGPTGVPQTGPGDGLALP
jgi:hypothetical protein